MLLFYRWDRSGYGLCCCLKGKPLILSLKHLYKQGEGDGNIGLGLIWCVIFSKQQVNNYEENEFN